LIDAGGLRDGERSGLVVFGTDYGWIGVERAGVALRIVMRRAIDAPKGGPEEELAAEPVMEGPVTLEVSVSAGGLCRFAIVPSSGVPRELGPAFQARPGRWVGAKVGLFAAAPESRIQTGHVVVRSFLMTSR
jgi:hypothetical protein